MGITAGRFLSGFTRRLRVTHDPGSRSDHCAAILKHKISSPLAMFKAKITVVRYDGAGRLYLPLRFNMVKTRKNPDLDFFPNE